MVVRRETLQTVRPATSADASRYALAKIQIEPDGTCVATNGHVLIRAKESYPLAETDYPIVPGVPTEHTTPTAPILVSAEIADKLCKAMPKRSSLPILGTVQVCTNGDGSAYAAATDLTVPVVVKLTPEEGETFPEYARVVPGERPSVAITIGLPVLEVLLKSAKASGSKAIRFELPTESQYHDKGTTDVNNAIKATYRGSDVEATAVLMPMRI